MTDAQSIKLGRYTALLSFTIGTSILFFFYMTSADMYLFIGYIYAIFAGIVNLIVLLFLIQRKKDSVNRKQYSITYLLVLLNIPVLALYCFLGIFLLNVMRITFGNATDSTLYDIHITGCENHSINQLKPGESKCIWVGIHGDCSIDIDYLHNDERKAVNVAGYVTNSMGQSIEFNIGESESVF